MKEEDKPLYKRSDWIIDPDSFDEKPQSKGRRSDLEKRTDVVGFRTTPQVAYILSRRSQSKSTTISDYLHELTVKALKDEPDLTDKERRALEVAEATSEAGIEAAPTTHSESMVKQYERTLHLVNKLRLHGISKEVIDNEIDNSIKTIGEYLDTPLRGAITDKLKTLRGVK